MNHIPSINQLTSTSKELEATSMPQTKENREWKSVAGIGLSNTDLDPHSSKDLDILVTRKAGKWEVLALGSGAKEIFQSNDIPTELHLATAKDVTELIKSCFPRFDGSKLNKRGGYWIHRNGAVARKINPKVWKVHMFYTDSSGKSHMREVHAYTRKQAHQELLVEISQHKQAK